MKEKLWELLSLVGIVPLYYRVFYWKSVKNSKQFFRDNKDRLNECVKLFFDIKSKNTYLRAIKYRSTYNILFRPKVDKEKQYFNSLTPLSILKEGNYIDCGAYTGDTVELFLSVYKEFSYSVIAFEPDTNNCNILSDKFCNNPSIKIINGGVWSKNTTIKFNSSSSAGSNVCENGESEISVFSIDSMEECCNVAFIKMDIEGSELKALEGARKTIVRDRPILAICLYHKDEDFLEIPEYISKNIQGYRLFCKHYSFFTAETILYAIPEECYF